MEKTMVITSRGSVVGDFQHATFRAHSLSGTKASAKRGILPSEGFLICGKKTHGKSYFGENILPAVLLSTTPTFSNILITKQYKVRGYYTQTPRVNLVEVFAFADALKKDFCEDAGISRGDLEKSKEEYRGRLFEYSKIKRTGFQDYYTEKVADCIKGSDVSNAVVITDFRQPEEYEYLKKRFGSIPWTIVRIVDHLKDAESGRLKASYDLVEDPMEGFLKDVKADITLFRKSYV
jgi:hypothetical protein